jgi:hypothetical protein
MSKMQSALVIIYLIGTCYFFVNWLRFHLHQVADSPEDSFLSLVTLAIATIFWFLLIPIHCLKIFQKKQLDFSVVVSVLIALSAFALVFHLL